MSLEQALQENTAALNALAAIMRDAPAAQPEVKAEKPAAAKPPTVAPPAPPAADPAPESAPVVFADVSAAVVAAISRLSGKAPVLQALKELIPTGLLKDAKAEDYQAIIGIVTGLQA